MAGALLRAAAVELFSEQAADLVLVDRPMRGEQLALFGIARDAVEDLIRRQVLDEVGEPGDVGLRREDLDLSAAPLMGELRAGEDHQVVHLDPVNLGLCEGLGGAARPFSAIAGEAEDRVSDRQQATGLDPPSGVVELCEGVEAIDRE